MCRRQTGMKGVSCLAALLWCGLVASTSPKTEACRLEFAGLVVTKCMTWVCFSVFTVAPQWLYAARLCLLLFRACSGSGSDKGTQHDFVVDSVVKLKLPVWTWSVPVTPEWLC